MRKIFMLTVLITLALLLISCGGPEKAIVGQWQCEDGSSIQFLDDGTLMITGAIMPASGVYSFPDKEHIKIQLDGLGSLAGAQTLTVDISGDTLTIDGGVCKR